MPKDAWLPINYELVEGGKLRILLHSDENWQIYGTSGSDRVLIVLLELAHKWDSEGLLDSSAMRDIQFGSFTFKYLISPGRYILQPIDSCNSPDSKVDALSFSHAMRESRKVAKSPSFHDAIFVDQYSRLLPTWTLSSEVADSHVLGSWLTGGVSISTDSFRRLYKLTSWMKQSDLAEVISAAGLPVQAGIELRSRPSSSTQQLEKESQKEAAEPPTPNARCDTESEKFTLPGRPHLENFFNEHVIDIICNHERYENLGISFPSATVLHGPPGCGKTFAVEKLVEFIDWPSYSIDSGSVGSPFIHDTSKKISEVFDKAIEDAPSVIIIDEMESFLSERQSGANGLHHIEEVAEFLRRIPEAVKKRVLIIAMTNIIDMIDPAILRRGRFDHILEVGMPSRIEVKSLLDSLLEKIPTSTDLDVEPLLESFTGKPLSDAAFLVREAARLAAKAGKKEIDQTSLDKALEAFPGTVKKSSNTIGFIKND